MQKKNTKIWIILLLAPIVMLVLTAVFQVIVRFAIGGNNGDGGVLLAIINIVSFLGGILAVLGLFGAPIWVIMLVLAIQHNNKIANMPNNPTNTTNPNLAPTHTDTPADPSDMQ